MKVMLALLAVAVASSAARAQSRVATITPAKPEPGAIVRIVVNPPSTSDSVRGIRGMLAGEPLHFARAATGWGAIGGIPVDAADSIAARVFVDHASGRVDSLRVSATLPKPPKPVASKLSVDSQFTQPLDSATEARIVRENEKAREVGRRAHLHPAMWTEVFLAPRASSITSRFGSGRVFNGAVTSRHLGVDYQGAVGDPIRAANRGVVALVDTFFLAGRVVYIDHGGGVVTGYFHMSEPLVAIGDTVQRGQQIGKVGKTGRVTGPHLHWSARYGAITVNPGDLLGVRVKGSE